MPSACLTALTGAEAALVVNNNAAALVIALAALARDREVVVSRGELVEIGGSFRIPEIMAAAGARLVEVGATNRTRLADYEAAVGPATALLLKVYPSNFRLTGFVASVAPRQLAELGARAGVPVLVDEGSGLLRPRHEPQLADHPSLAELIEQGCDLACGSGDKLLGGPQAGLLVGRAELAGALPQASSLSRAPPRPHGPGGARRGAPPPPRRGSPAARPPVARSGSPPRPSGAACAARLEADIVPAEAFLGGGAAPEAPIPGEALALPGDDDTPRAVFARASRRSSAIFARAG